MSGCWGLEEVFTFVDYSAPGASPGKSPVLGESINYELLELALISGVYIGLGGFTIKTF